MQPVALQSLTERCSIASALPPAVPTPRGPERIMHLELMASPKRRGKPEVPGVFGSSVPNRRWEPSNEVAIVKQSNRAMV